MIPYNSYVLKGGGRGGVFLLNFKKIKGFILFIQDLKIDLFLNNNYDIKLQFMNILILKKVYKIY